MNRTFFRWGLLGGAALLVGCAGDTGDSAANWGEVAEQTKQALEQCDVGLAYNAGRWMEEPFDLGCSLATTTFSFGAASDLPLLLSDRPISHSSSIATYGTTVEGDRLGRFFIDRDHSRSWSGGDTNTRFMLTPQVGDQPFIIATVIRRLQPGPAPGFAGASGVSSCTPVLAPAPSFPQSVIGIKRGAEWFVDGNGNGTWDGATECDIYSGGFGGPSDIPTPVATILGTASASSGAAIVWNFDTNSSWNWNGAPPDQTLATFGSSPMRPFSDGASGKLGAQNGIAVYLDKNGDRIWNGAPTDIEASGYLPSSAWIFVGWYEASL
jgi:hypothetical protein